MAGKEKRLPYPKEPGRKVQHATLHEKRNYLWCTKHERWVSERKWNSHKMCDLITDTEKNKKPVVGHGLRVARKSKPSKRGLPKREPKRTHHGDGFGGANVFCAVHGMVSSTKWDDHKKHAAIGTKRPKRKRSKGKRISKVVHYCGQHGKFVGYTWGGHRKTCRAKEVSKEAWERAEGYSTRVVSQELFVDRLNKIGIESATFNNVGDVQFLEIGRKVDSSIASFGGGDRVLTINGYPATSKKAVVSAIEDAMSSKERSVRLAVRGPWTKEHPNLHAVRMVDVVIPPHALIAPVSLPALAKNQLISKQMIQAYLGCVGIVKAKLSPIKRRALSDQPALLIQKVTGSDHPLKRGDKVLLVNQEIPRNLEAVVLGIYGAIQSKVSVVKMLYIRRGENVTRPAEVPLRNLEAVASTASKPAETLPSKSAEGTAFVRSEQLLVKAANSINEQLHKAQEDNKRLYLELRTLEKKVQESDDEVSRLENRRGDFYLKMETLAQEVSSLSS